MAILNNNIKNLKTKKIKCLDIEIAVSNFFGIRTNLIVPNISWGLLNHECDLFILTNAGYGYEVEIKISKQDLIKDKDKKHKHFDQKLKYLYFAIPEYLENCIEHIPENAGIIIVRWISDVRLFCEIIREPKQIGHYRFSDDEKFQIARLGAMRIWRLKSKLNQKILK